MVRRLKEKETTGDERADLALKVVSILGIVVAVIAIFYFLNSSLPERIVGSKQYALSVEQHTNTNTPENTASFQIDVTQDEGGQRDILIREIAEMDGEMFDEFVDAVVDAAGIRTPVDSDDEAPIDLESVFDQDDVSADDVLPILETLDDSVLDVLVDALSSLKSGDVFMATLEEAYAEAERLYPGQVDGSKRLSLIDELNAVDFKYYIAENGDTLLALSQAFDVPLGQLVELNGIQDADVIPAGMILLFPEDVSD